MGEPIFKPGDRVTKTKGSNWTGRVVGTYSTALTPEGYAVESETEKGSVQIYPAAALSPAPALPESGVDLNMIARRMQRAGAPGTEEELEAALAAALATPAPAPAPESGVEDGDNGSGPYTCTACLSATWNDDDRCDACREEALAASVPAPAPAPAPVDDEPVARPYWRDYPAGQKVSPALSFEGGCLTINGQGYGDNDGAGTFAFKDDDLLWGHGEDEGYRYIHLAKSELEAIRHAIAASHGPYAKPAPAPVDAVRLTEEDHQLLEKALTASTAPAYSIDPPASVDAVDQDDMTIAYMLGFERGKDAALAAAAERQAALVRERDEAHARLAAKFREIADLQQDPMFKLKESMRERAEAAEARVTAAEAHEDAQRLAIEMLTRRATSAEAERDAERERCAAIVDDWIAHHAACLNDDAPSPAGRHSVAVKDGRAIAAAIRKETT